MTVFGTYDLVAFDIFGKNADRNDPIRHALPEPTHLASSSDSSHTRRSLIASSTPVLVHAAAGLGAGVAHSGVLVLWEILTRRKHPHWSARRLRVVQHSLGYACLFGTYEGTRRLLEYSCYDALSTHEERVLEVFARHPQLDWLKHDHKDNDGTYEVPSVRWAVAFAAGGVAGYTHQLVMHAMSHSQTGEWRKIIPTIRPSMSTFCLTGLCFVAFEFGGEWTERTLLKKSLT
jgi:hypothetical protein